MKKTHIQSPLRKVASIAAFGLFSISASAQTNVFDDVIAASPNHSSLEVALIAAGLDDDLQNHSGTFTVFAPDNAAFSALATQLGVTVSDLLALPNLATALGTDLAGILNLPNLSDVLTYHAVLGNVNAADLVNGPVATVNGANIIVNLASGVKINDATVTTADVEADNGDWNVSKSSFRCDFNCWFERRKIFNLQQSRSSR